MNLLLESVWTSSFALVVRISSFNYQTGMQGASRQIDILQAQAVVIEVIVLLA